MTHSALLTDAEAIEQMARYGITRIVAYEYRYKDYRYSSLADAIAQGKRDRRPA